MQLAVRETLPTPVPPRGPTLFEIEYLGQIQEELALFLKGSNCTTLQQIVIGVQGSGYQVVVPVTADGLE